MGTQGTLSQSYSYKRHDTFRRWKYVYLLAYPEYKPETHLQLYRLSISDGSYEALGDSIPLTSEEIATNANLYFNKKLEEFYCVTQEFENTGNPLHVSTHSQILPHRWQP